MEQSGEAGDASVLFERWKGYRRLYGWEHALTLGAAKELLGDLRVRDEPPREAMLELIGGLIACGPKVYGWSVEAFNAKLSVTRALRRLGEYDLAIAELRALLQARERFQDWHLGWSVLLLAELVAYELDKEQFAEVIVHASWLTEQVAEEVEDGFLEVIMDDLSAVIAYYVCALLAVGEEETALGWARTWLSMVEERDPNPRIALGSLELLQFIDLSPRRELVLNEWRHDILPRINRVFSVYR